MSFAITTDTIADQIKKGIELDLRGLLVMLKCQKDKQKVAQLAATISVPKPSVTRAIDRLEQANKPLLAREIDPDDRRSPWIVLTPAGKRFLKDILIEL